MAKQRIPEDELPSTNHEEPHQEAPPKNMAEANFGDFLRSTEHHIINQKIREELEANMGLKKIERGECPEGAWNPIACWFCPYGHATECHHPLTCEEAECSHYQQQYEQELFERDLYDDRDCEEYMKEETKPKNQPALKKPLLRGW